MDNDNPQSTAVTERPARLLLGLRHHEWRMIGLVISIKALLFLFVGQSYQVLQNQRLAGPRGWLEIWNRWDAVNYQKLAQFGYVGTGEMRPLLVFYPLYPWTVRLFAFLTGDYLLSAFIISTVSSFVVAIVLLRLFELDFSKELAQRAVWFLFIFPTSYFLHIGYTESLFLMLALSCIYAARKQHWLLAGLLGALCCLTRGNGVVLVPALAAEAGYQYWLTRRWRWQWLWIAVVTLGFGGYLLLIRHAAGSAFAFFSIRTEFFHISLATPLEGVLSTLVSMTRTPAEAEMVGVQEFLFVMLGCVCTVVCWIKLRVMYAVWMTGNLLLVISLTFVASVPRYTLTMFPIYILFSQLATRRLWFAVITIWSLLYLGFFASLFACGRWAF